LNIHGLPSVKPMTVKDHSSTDDQTLVRAAQQGDMAAFEELVARHRDRIYARAYSMMRKKRLIFLKRRG
jgi:hypothetical protein